MLRGGWLLAVLAGCGPGEVDSDTEPVGGCGEVTTSMVDLTVTVVGPEDQPIDGASVSLEERAWEPGTLGTGTTDSSGEVLLANLDITGVEDCWGTVLDYVVVVALDERSAESRVNPTLFNAINGGGGVAVKRITLDD